MYGCIPRAGQKRAPEPLERELQTGVNSSANVRVLGVEPGSPAELIALAALEILLNSLTGDMETG